MQYLSSSSSASVSCARRSTAIVFTCGISRFCYMHATRWYKNKFYLQRELFLFNLLLAPSPSAHHLLLYYHSVRRILPFVSSVHVSLDRSSLSFSTFSLWIWSYKTFVGATPLIYIMDGLVTEHIYIRENPFFVQAPCNKLCTVATHDDVFW